MQTIGLVGGMSWESSLVYYRDLNVGVQERLGGLARLQLAQDQQVQLGRGQLGRVGGQGVQRTGQCGAQGGQGGEGVSCAVWGACHCGRACGDARGYRARQAVPTRVISLVLSCAVAEQQSRQF